MDKKLTNMKQSVKFMSVMAKVGYIASIVVFCICVSVLTALAIMGGETSVAIGESTRIVVADESVDVSVTIVNCSVWLVLSAFLFAILFPAFRMLNEITHSGNLFDAKHVKTIRLSGILLAVMTVCGGITEMIAAYCMGIKSTSVYSEIPGILIGAVVFCFAFIYDYACEKFKQQVAPEESTAVSEADNKENLE